MKNFVRTVMPLAFASVSASRVGNTMPGMEVKFELKNINYEDLEKTVPVVNDESDPAQKKVKASKSKKTDDSLFSSPAAAEGDVVDTAKDVSSDHSKAVRDTAKKISSSAGETVRDVSKGAADAANGVHDTVEQGTNVTDSAISDGADAAHDAVHGGKSFLELTSGTRDILLVNDIVTRAIMDAFTEQMKINWNKSGNATTNATPDGVDLWVELMPGTGKKVAQGAEEKLANGGADAGFGPKVKGETQITVDGTQGSHNVTIFSSHGFNVGDIVEIGVHGRKERRQIESLKRFPSSQIVYPVFTNGLGRDYPRGTVIRVVNKVGVPVAAEPKDYPQPEYGAMIFRHVNRHLPDDTQGRTTIARVILTGKPNTSVDEVPDVEDALTDSADSGNLEDCLVKHLQDMTGINASLSDFDITVGDIVEQWSVDGCNQHMQEVVRKFEKSYTRRMVPFAILNECTNYGPVMTFSHDHRPTPIDVAKCRRAAQKFVKHWNYGYGKNSPKPVALNAKKGLRGNHHAHHALEPVDMTGFCVDFCEQKFGRTAPKCNVALGDGNGLSP